MTYWWVNQGQTFEEEMAGGYLWSPKRKSDGARFVFYDNMREVAPDDLIFCYSGSKIKAIGQATSYCYESPRPAEFPSNPNTNRWGNIGWRVDVLYHQDIEQIRPKSHIGILQPLLPKQYSPIRADGNGNQNLYLAELPESMAKALLRLTNPKTGVFTARAPVNQQGSAAKEAWETDILHEIESSQSVAETEKKALVTSRLGQGIFRERLTRIESKCRVTGLINPALLVASHIKPWRHSNNTERLDGENGLLLCPNIDRLFDRGFISFTTDGRILTAPAVDVESLRIMGVVSGMAVGPFTAGQRRYLEYHRQFIFLGP